MLGLGLNQINAQVNLNFGLIAQYNFTDESLDDSGPNFLNLINNNGATPAADRFGNANYAYQFDGIDDYLSASNDPIFTLGFGATISMWVNLNDVTTNQKLIGKLSTPPITTDGGYLIGVENGQFKIETWVVGSTAYSLTAGNIVPNQWTHIAVTFQSTNFITLHVDGQPVDSIMVPDALEANSNDLIIGAAPWDPTFFKTEGLIDDIRIYNRKVNNAELNAIFTEVVTANKTLKQNEYSFYNNNGVYTINSVNAQKIKSIVVFDLNGKVANNQSLNNTTTASINLTNFPKGIYYANIISNDGVKTIKLVN
jgi:hypothetical protein